MALELVDPLTALRAALEILAILERPSTAVM